MMTAAIDVGSNTIRLLLGSVKNEELTRLHTERSITRLASGVAETGLLREDTMQQALAVMKTFSLVLSRHDAQTVRAVGTSALREARNSQVFIDRVLEETGLQIEIISGEEEARLTATGVLLGFENPGSSPLIMDIGGGSTEWIIQPERNTKPLAHGSVPVGVVNLYERFIKTDPLSDTDAARLLDEIELRFSPVKYDILNHLFNDARLIATGGTLTTLAALDLGLKKYTSESIHLHTIPLDRLCRLKDRLLSLTLSQRQDLEGLEPKRADLIIPGILLTIRVLEIFGFEELIVSDYGILEGVIAG